MILRGQIYMADLKNSAQHLLQKVRPVVVISNNTGNTHSDIVIVACLTTKRHKTKQPTHVFIKNIPGIYPSTIICEQIFTINQNQLLEYKGRLNEKQLYKLNTALKISLNLY